MREGAMGRRWVQWSIPVVSVCAVLGATALLGSRVPDPMAIHWSASGPDGTGSLGLVTALNAGMIVVLGGGMILAAARAPEPAAVRALVASGTGLSAMLAFIHLWTLNANVDAATWEQAGDLGLALPGSFGVLALAGGVGWVLARRATVRPRPQQERTEADAG